MELFPCDTRIALSHLHNEAFEWVGKEAKVLVYLFLRKHIMFKLFVRSKHKPEF